MSAPPQVAKRTRGRMFDNKEPRQGRKTLFDNGFLSPLQGSHFAFPFQGFTSFTPGYYLVAPSGLAQNAGFATETI